MIEDYGLAGLFISSFLSSTILPGGSEAVLASLALYNHHSMAVLLIVATAGNTLGGLSSWLIGFLVARRWPADRLEKPANRRAVVWLQRYGSPVLLFSWLPVVGDPLCVAAGWLRINFWQSLVLIAAGKLSRYLAVVLLMKNL